MGQRETAALVALTVLLLIMSRVAAAGDLEAELGSLETASRSGAIAPVQLQRLAEIYFLTSRCSDVVRVLKGRRPPGTVRLLCVCGGHCPDGSEVARMAMLRRLLEKGVRWGDGRVQSVWRRVSSMPEARYWALKYLMSNPASFRDPRLYSVRLELEKGLESLEVRP